MKDAVKMMENNMSPEAVQRAHIKAEQDIMKIRLAQFQEEQKTNQPDITNFTIPAGLKKQKKNYY